MLELVFALAILACMFSCFVLGVAGVMADMRRTDADLYFEWMRRRDARKERK